MKAIVGLGNPGPEYKGTRHNIGFEVIDELARRWGLKLKSWKSAAAMAVAKEHETLLAEPKTFMNLSGEAVRKISAFHQIEPSDLLIVVDDVNLPLGRLRFRQMGSAGGHNGLKSVIQHLGTEFPRLRIGVGRGDSRRDLADHVLARFESDEAAEVERMTARAADAAEMFTTAGIAAVMNAYNGGDPATTE
ncbi:MAG TPA: aminoacyl-tRNA hydrolase [Vicinamibacterales bacterium]